MIKEILILLKKYNLEIIKVVSNGSNNEFKRSLYRKWKIN